MPTQGDYTMRAQPRRRKESSSKGDEPVFLRKTYDMINTCDPSLACWSTKGDTFLIKNPERFASEIIPTFFKHSKFSSFVRQLNFYGFRKVKSAIALADDATDKSQWWEFKHELFSRSTPNLLSEIKRATHYVAPPEKEVDALKGEVSILQARVSRMDDQLAALTSVIQNLVLDQNPNIQPSSSKKRKAVKATFIEFFQNDENLNRIGSMNSIESDVKSEFIPESEFKHLEHSEEDIDFTQDLDFLRTMSIESTGTPPEFFDSELLADMTMPSGIQFTDFDSAVMQSPLSSSHIVESSDTTTDLVKFEQPDSKMLDAEELAGTIINLPEDLQVKLREGVLALLNSSEGPSKPSDSPDVERPLATAALCALLSQFSHRQGLIPLSGQIESMA